MIEAPCRHDPDLWFDWGLPGTPGYIERPTEAKRRCMACPLLTACRAVADEHEGHRTTNLFGIWAAETPAERLERRGLAKPKAPASVKAPAPKKPARPRLSPAEQSRRARARLDQRVTEARKAWWR